jgi:hypothetical protein
MQNVIDVSCGCCKAHRISQTPAFLAIAARTLRIYPKGFRQLVAHVLHLWLQRMAMSLATQNALPILWCAGVFFPMSCASDLFEASLFTLP